jgi:hypothetical protein
MSVSVQSQRVAMLHIGLDGLTSSTGIRAEKVCVNWVESGVGNQLPSKGVGIEAATVRSAGLRGTRNEERGRNRRT